jgi:hypothetical protein
MKKWVFDKLIEPLFRTEIALREVQLIERMLLRYGMPAANNLWDYKAIESKKIYPYYNKPNLNGTNLSNYERDRKKYEKENS